MLKGTIYVVGVKLLGPIPLVPLYVGVHLPASLMLVLEASTLSNERAASATWYGVRAGRGANNVDWCC